MSAGSCGCLLVCQLGHFSHWTTGSPHPKRASDPTASLMPKCFHTQSHLYRIPSHWTGLGYYDGGLCIQCGTGKRRQLKPLCLLLVKSSLLQPSWWMLWSTSEYPLSGTGNPKHTYWDFTGQNKMTEDFVFYTLSIDGGGEGWTWCISPLNTER